MWETGIDSYGIIKNVSGLCPNSWRRASKTPGISRKTGVPFVIHYKPLSTTPEYLLIR